MKQPKTKPKSTAKASAKAKAKPAPVKSTPAKAKPAPVVTAKSQASDLDLRVARLEKKINSNERFARTFVRSFTAQTVATDAVRDLIRKSFCDDAEMRTALYAAMDTYDKRRRRKLISNLGSIILWILSVAVAAFVGAFIHWVFSGQQ